MLPLRPNLLKTNKPLPYHNPPRTLGEHLRRRRHELGMFQKDVADRLGVNQWTLIGWEQNRKKPAVRLMPRIIRFLGYDPNPLHRI